MCQTSNHRRIKIYNKLKINNNNYKMSSLMT